MNPQKKWQFKILLLRLNKISLELRPLCSTESCDFQTPESSVLFCFIEMDERSGRMKKWKESTDPNWATGAQMALKVLYTGRLYSILLFSIASYQSSSATSFLALRQNEQIER